ncbi:methyltransferase domain-containing protein [Rhodoblastus sp.]|jgi:2-polyprenyl-3-methyl-5-hydroxy-6-metoxy-1,4-benzoquinol methylase|uniref:methyltransferase domain-containing protein n=1 Tax=Rhodoblastus sp. TaxID=1962975 RepID=UPI002611008A|nr:methyltransferase domain-containing protein [Rhodoblastus sp.]
MKRDIGKYQASYLSDEEFERFLVRYRQDAILALLAEGAYGDIIEIGCGSELLYEKYLHAGCAPVRSWLIVEPGDIFATRAEASQLPSLEVMRGFFESSVPAILERREQPPDYIICSGLIHEVESADHLLNAIKAVAAPHTILHINTPNARSFHRRLALAMKIIPDLRALSPRNLTMQHHRVYDLDRLLKDLSKAGFEMIRNGGYFVKPFTHKQMEAISPDLGDAILDGLFELGREYPDWACEIFVEARLR